MSIIGRIGVVFARQWIAGTSEYDAINAAKKINSSGKKAILNYLGENFTEEAKIKKSILIYESLLNEMMQGNIRGSISVKPSQLGILKGEGEFYTNLKKIALYAKRLGYNVWVDAEEYEYIERTHRVYLRLLKETKNIGLGIQTRLKRSLKDAERVANSHGMVRIVKGAYAEPEERAYTTYDDIRENYVKIMELLFRKRCKLVVATHDEYLIFKAVSLEKRYGTRAVFAMLKGIRGRLADRLVEKGEEVHLYVPFGEEWFSYSIRRLTEEGHALLLIRSIFQQ